MVSSPSLRGPTNPIELASNLDATENSVPINSNAAVADDFEDEKAPFLRDAAGVIIVSSACVGSAVTAAAEIASKPPSSSYSHILIRDRPIDQIPILMGHNAGTQPGSGTVIGIGNQTLSIDQTLHQTPIRGFEIDLWHVNGETVVLHGGVPEPGSNPSNLSGTLEPIRQWLDESHPQNEIVYLMIEDHLAGDKTDAALAEIQKTFGNAIFTQHDQEVFYQEHGRWPTVDEITASGNRVMIITDDTGSYGNIAFNSRDIEQRFGHIWEDRSLIGVLGSDFNSEIVGKIDTEEMDRLVAQGGIIKLDQISANDPRFFTEEYRSRLALHPDISVGGLSYIGNEDWQNICLGFGTSLAVGSTSLGVLQAGVYAQANYKLLNDLENQVCQALNSLTTFDIEHWENTSGKHIENLDLADVVRLKFTSKITGITAKAGATGTVSAAGSMLALGMLFPPAFAPLAIAALATLALGSTATAAATMVNRRKLQDQFAQLLKSEKIGQALVRNRARLVTQLQDIVKGNQLVSQTINNRKASKHVSTAANSVLAGTLLVRISSMGKYAMPVVGTAAWIAAAVVGFAGTVVAGSMNFIRRRTQLAEISQTAIACIIPRIHQRKLGVLGNTPFNSYVRRNRKAIRNALDLPQKTGVKNIIKELARPELSDIRQNYESKCATEIIYDGLTKFARSKKIEPDQMYSASVLEEFAIKQVANFAHNDALAAGAAGTIKIAASVGSLSLVLPQFGGFIWIGAASVIPVGLAVSEIIALTERQKFAKKARRLLNGNTGELLPAELKHKAELGALLELLAAMRPN